MGQAKQRGTFEQRQAAAAQRNEALLATLPKDLRHSAQKFVRKFGVQRLATVLIAGGLIGKDNNARD